MNDNKSSSIKVFIVFSIAFLLSSCLIGTLYGAKKNDFEVKKTISNKKNEINYVDVKNYSLDKYSSEIKNHYLNNLKKEHSKEIKIDYYDVETKQKTDNYYKIYIENGMLYTYESENGSKVNVDYKETQYDYIVSCKLSDDLNSDYLIAIIKNDKTINMTKFNYNTKKISEPKKLDSIYKIKELYTIKNEINNSENIYLFDDNKNLYMIYEEKEEYYVDTKDLFNTNNKLHSYSFDNKKMYINYDGTLSYENNLIKDANGNIIFANDIFTDCINTEKEEYVMYIIDYRGMLYKKIINSDFINNSLFEVVGKIKGINLEESKKGIQKINYLFNNENEELIQAGTVFERFKLTE